MSIIPEHYARYLNGIFSVFETWQVQAMTTGRVYLVPIQIPFICKIDRIIPVWEDPCAGNVRAGIYEDNGDTPVGGAVVVESASVAKSGGWQAQEIPVAETRFAPSLFWLALEGDENTTEFQYVTLGGQFRLGACTLMCYYYDRAGGYGALTDPCPAVTSYVQGPVMKVRVSSVP